MTGPNWDRTATFIADEEVFVAHVYDDGDRAWPRPRYAGGPVLGTLTVGYGETSPDIVAEYFDHDMTEAEAWVLLRDRIQGYWHEGVERWLRRPLPSPNMAGALTSFAYNAGVNALPRLAPGLLAALNWGWWARAAQLLRTSVLKRPQFDLSARRAREAEWFLEDWTGGPGPFLPLLAAA